MAKKQYPDAKLLGRERKVKGRKKKEKRRGGTKGRKKIKTEYIPGDLSDFMDSIICGDSEVVLKSFPENSVDLVLTSPPYNFGLEYKADDKEDSIDWNEYFSKIECIWTECVRILKPGGRFCLNVQPLFSDYIPTHHVFSKQLLDLGLLWKGEILWEKHNYNCKYTAWGSWKSPSMPYLKYTWEFVEIFCKESQKKPGDSNKIDITGDEFKKWVYAKWDIAPERDMKKFGHPAMFPEELATRILKLFSYRDDVILDPFNGVGTTTLVARKSGRHYIGIDISDEYCEKAKARIREYEKQKKLDHF
jgi:DNA modification methylase